MTEERKLNGHQTCKRTPSSGNAASRRRREALNTGTEREKQRRSRRIRRKPQSPEDSKRQNEEMVQRRRARDCTENETTTIKGGKGTSSKANEVEALLKWKASILNHNNPLISSWNLQPPANPCAWYGVFCIHRRINGLNLTKSNLNGTLYKFPFSSLPSLEFLDLGNITKLTVFYLVDNSLSAPIPINLENFGQLKYLDFCNNKLSGSIPSSLDNLTKLITINLGDNSLSDSIQINLGNLGQLEYLALGYNKLSGSIPSALERGINKVYKDISPIPHSFLLTIYKPKKGIISRKEDNGLEGRQLRPAISGRPPPTVGGKLGSLGHSEQRPTGDAFMLQQLHFFTLKGRRSRHKVFKIIKSSTLLQESTFTDIFGRWMRVNIPSNPNFKNTTQEFSQKLESAMDNFENNSLKEKW
ncbi:hypothetical protein M9H77_16808 [Catharanthus roseus]|uniref:Uncharacterized protein n=1 Tax=Catharanthus roseus TaxID=4058 RepID=A0ACC0B2T0_CATRO|nr:hypothetical protein M9H77_16808 [Catharanthus roseus]